MNLPYYQCHYNQDVDCGPSGCADSAIQNYTAQLADASSHNIPRNESLRYVVHFIGDIHQPLHAGNRNDSNGNKLQALWFNGVVYADDRNVTNLHSIWDTGIIDTRIKRDFHGEPAQYFHVRQLTPIKQRHDDTAETANTAHALSLCLCLCLCCAACVLLVGLLQYLERTLHTVYEQSMEEWRRCGQAPQSQQDNYNACSWQWIQESSALACSAAYLHTNGTRMDLTGFLNLSDAYYHGQPHTLTHTHTHSSAALSY